MFGASRRRRTKSSPGDWRATTPITRSPPRPWPTCGDEPRYVAFVVRPGRGSPARVHLGPAKPIDQAVNEWLERVEHQDEGAVEETGRRLRLAVWEPLAPLLAGATRVLVSPDGLLNFLPGVLPGQAPGTYLVSERSFATVIAARQLVAGRQTHPPPASGLLTVCGVNYGEVDDAPGPACAPRCWLRGLALLSSGRDHCILIRSKRPRPRHRRWRRSTASSRPRLQLLTSSILRAAQPRGRRILQEIAGRRFLHLATHGYFSAAAHGGARPRGCLDPTRIGADGLDDAPRSSRAWSPVWSSREPTSPRAIP